MKFYKCDICGKVIETGDTLAQYGSKSQGAHNGIFGSIAQNKDICGRCMTVGETLDFEKIVMREWRLAAEGKINKETADQYPDGVAIINPVCESFTVKFGVPRCYGTKEMEVCHCCGDTQKCDFYPAESVKKSEK